MTTPALPSEQSTRGLATLTPCELLPKDGETERGLAAARVARKAPQATVAVA